MTNKLVFIINSLKVPKTKKILLYEMKFLVPNYSCLQNPWLRGCCPQIPVLSVLNWICWTPPPPRIKFLGTPQVQKMEKMKMIGWPSSKWLWIMHATCSNNCSSFRNGQKSGSRCRWDKVRWKTFWRLMESPQMNKVPSMAEGEPTSKITNVRNVSSGTTSLL